MNPQEQPTGTGETDVDTVPDMGLTCGAAVLMEASSGTVLYRMNESDELPPASVTKIMTLLLVMEALEAGNLALTDTVTISGYAASMGGSQVFLEEGEQMSVEDLIKCTVIASANDAAVALAEQVMGSETAFVERMNQRAAELGLTGAHFENVTGLDDDTENHVMSAMDIAVISRELIRHPLILEYSSVWMDTIRDGAFTLTNTNRLIRFYQGATGLKTGSTEKAKFCITATAERNGMTLIAVIMTAPSRDDRNSDAKKLFDWVFCESTDFSAPLTSSSVLDFTCSLRFEIK
ncbi:MAG: D-alanyl-D-alanine carboxypeptidase family protein [Eubacteriales bacterium]